MQRSRALIASFVATLTAGLFAGAGSSLAAPTVPPEPPRSVGPNYGGQAAVDHLGPRLPDVARAHGLDGQKLRTMFRTDKGLRVDPDGRLLYVEAAPTPDEVAASTSSAGSDSLPTGSVADVFDLHSRPGSPLSIYLDFDGHVTEGTAWNSSARTRIVSDPFDIDRTRNSFSTLERDRIHKIWLRVAEDFAPWDVDVTTRDPGVEALSKTSSTDGQYGIRVVVSPTNWYAAGVGGVAHVGSFTWDDTPTFVFSDDLGYGDEKFVTEAISHEVGHTVNLHHDGSPTSGYYGGHEDWAPLMGVGYYRDISQWSAGEYAGATNLQDDVAIISGFLPPRSDEHGDTAESAAALPVSFLANGLIGTRSDVDVFRVDVGAGRLTATMTPAAPSPNLDASLTVRNADGTQVAYADPLGAAAPSVEVTVPAGTYYLAVDGVGRGTLPLGYSDYASLGRYVLSGSGVDPSGGGTTTTTLPSTTTTGEPPTTATTLPSTTTTDAPTTTTTSPPATSLLSVHSLRIAPGSASKTAFAQAVVLDATGRPIPGVVVSGTWSGQARGKATATTDTSGTATTATAKLRKSGLVSFTVTSVQVPAGSDLVWDGVTVTTQARL